MSTSPVQDDIVELAPPVDTGWPGTAKFSRATDATMIEELVKRGYTVVKSAE